MLLLVADQMTLRLRALEKISGQRFRRIEINGHTYLLSFVMLRPFKFFTVYEKAIREGLEGFEKLHMSQDDHHMTISPDKTVPETQGDVIAVHNKSVLIALGFSNNDSVDASIEEDAKIAPETTSNDYQDNNSDFKFQKMS